ncbi:MULTISPECIES: NUDIX domain-containing protein [unclassified Caulobacter]|uniref:NUDIX domain-containing protein n=1 Tax=unclassified Caulobacter TaxID=2648921 RepID=UPI000D3D7DE9|nr:MULTISPECIES: NUDIX domain-containing protein [unclassified Caulobacter]PTS89479.1 DNA mismatch repair protein MutT [Caulobacter sp. HMWF009]PTT06035.1 DNA mismatch repair protein MutT [Caulobacter sp. HMWF025]
MLWRRRIEPFTRPFVYAWFRLNRGLTLGVRGLVTDPDGRVLLIQHTYVPGWYMPGGGVERGETAETALAREMQEEAGIRVLGRPRLLSFHSNEVRHPGDHVLVYRIEAWEPCAASEQGEIHAVGWFAPDALPDDITPATRQRIVEALEGAESDVMW